MDLLVADTSVLVDLARGNLLHETFELPYRFVVPDLLYERELRDHGGDELTALGLVVAEVTSGEVVYARDCRRDRPALSLPDVFALAVAATRRGTLITGDRRLRTLAREKGVPCHGLLWLLDEMHRIGVPAELLHEGLQAIPEHPRCRLPARSRREAGQLPRRPAMTSISQAA